MSVKEGEVTGLGRWLSLRGDEMAKSVKVTVTKEAPVGCTVRASIDQVRLKFAGNTATKDVQPGTHDLSWSVLGSPGDKYSVKTTKPPGVKAGGKGTLGNEGRDAGVAEFTIKEPS
jgi:hypothetical protein